MRDVELSHSAKALLRAAKGDAPSAAARAKIWGSVATTAHAGGAAAAAGAAGKLVIGTLFGSAMTVGLAAVLMHLGSAAPAPVRALAAGAPHVVHAAPSATDAPPVPEPLAAVPPTSKAKVAPVPAHPPLGDVAAASPGAPGGPQVAEEDPLMREASIVAEARGALMRGDAAAALAAVQTAKSLPARQLQPEELALEAKALRALGRASEARDVGSALKTSYPDNALAR
jgi:hypothetical protein